jgi:hypothetical protein
MNKKFVFSTLFICLLISLEINAQFFEGGGGSNGSPMAGGGFMGNGGGMMRGGHRFGRLRQMLQTYGFLFGKLGFGGILSLDEF